MKPAAVTPPPAGALQAVQNVQAAAARQSNSYGKFEKGKGKSMITSYSPASQPSTIGQRPSMGGVNHSPVNQHSQPNQPLQSPGSQPINNSMQQPQPQMIQHQRFIMQQQQTRAPMQQQIPMQQSLLFNEGKLMFKSLLSF